MNISNFGGKRLWLKFESEINVFESDFGILTIKTNKTELELGLLAGITLVVSQILRSQIGHKNYSGYEIFGNFVISAFSLE